ncbi:MULTISPECIES: acyltransferase [unclassified Stenotrophomonas]|uniref:acyltransferase n=1 Tax=unclassified Stenotrophomonas TaxID=196198 RepID=UPI002447E3BD|nr:MULTISPECIES: acyltransferase [unclassified Stenotrophomonas]MBN5161739.1 acyltransferase [Stenotrophomonas maltophilia]MDG9846114.1 acyltransferase [Stenotrophomonas sp. GD04054]MDH0019349.1 acyltransferase [Stenotrophomonas sp. GD04028]MDH0575537.1 acyltransferase [Stenotrophomonas sp. GD03997]MDH0861316.1 acyltransferase [Stenotrophomonas sp. GD03882]
MIAKDRLQFLDSLRGLAAVYVVLFHVQSMPAPTLTVAGWLLPVLQLGATGVALFFVISAFSLCYTQPRHRASGRPLLSFYLHRFLRIAPLFYLLLAFSIFRDGRGSHAGHPWAEIVANATFTFNLFPGWEQGIVWASWAVGVEMLFYAIFPLLYLLVDNGRRAWTLLLVLLGLAALAGTGALGARAEASLGGYGWLTHAPVFAMGLVAFHAYNALSQLSPARARWWGKALNMAGALLLLLVVAGIAAGWSGAGPWQLAGLGYLAVLLGCSQCPPRLLVNRATAWLGTVSYSLYLGHPIVIAVLGPVLHRLLAAVGDGTTGYLLCAALVLAVAMPLAALGHRCIEAPMIRLGKRVMASLSVSRAGPSPRQAEGGPR